MFDQGRRISQLLMTSAKTAGSGASRVPYLVKWSRGRVFEVALSAFNLTFQIIESKLWPLSENSAANFALAASTRLMMALSEARS
jgi:hypothetical protein